MNKKYLLRYLPLFEYDLLSAVDYISNDLKNPQAAKSLIDKTEKAILERLDSPLAYEPYHSTKPRKYPYYRIYVENYTIFLCSN